MQASKVFASPPGKKMQILSLLSGGERTLTHWHYYSPVFQTNPSPICSSTKLKLRSMKAILGGFCSLVEDVRAKLETRFLIITHQRLTMAKMDRLYGVTMSEKRHLAACVS